MPPLFRSLVTLFMLSCLNLSNVSAVQAVDSASTEAIINLPHADAWSLFTTESGLKSLGYTQARVDLQLEGVLQASGSSSLSDLNTVVISFDSERMLSFKPAATNSEWTVLYVTAMGKDMTQLRWLEYFAEPQRAAVEQHQAQVRLLFDQLIRRYAPECEVCKLEKARLK